MVTGDGDGDGDGRGAVRPVLAGAYTTPVPRGRQVGAGFEPWATAGAPGASTPPGVPAPGTGVRLRPCEEPPGVPPRAYSRVRVESETQAGGYHRRHLSLPTLDSLANLEPRRSPVESTE